jgi:hypothetical protein
LTPPHRPFEPDLAVRVPPAAADPAAEVPRTARHLESVGQIRAVEGREDRRTEFRRHALVGVETEHPVVARRVDGEVLLLHVARPVALDDARAAGGRALARRVLRVAVHDDPLRREVRGREALGDVVLLVHRHDADGNRRPHPRTAS